MKEREGEKRTANPLAILETNIDDMNPQIYGYLYDKLLEAGARDVWVTPILMKKGRPAHMLSVLVAKSEKETCANIIFRETTSIGIRVRPVEERIEADRHMAQVETRFGKVSCKVSAYGGHIVNVAPEYEDCRRLALEQQVPLKQVQQETMRAFNERLGD